MTTGLDCAADRRRADVRAAGLNGLDYVDVSADQLSLCLHFLGHIPENLTKANVRIEGGRRVRDIEVLDVHIHHAEEPDEDDCLEVLLDRRGDYSTYRICIGVPDREAPGGFGPYPGVDPRYRCLEFSFKVDCPSELDCKVEDVCPPEPQDAPVINYLAKDYPTLRQLLLDRLSLLLPDWQERHVPDIGITLVELMAFVADSLSYYQDAVATEAYLGTARQRISVRRHVRLVDYALSEGNNARAWVFVETPGGEVSIEPRDLAFVTDFPDSPPRGPALKPHQLPPTGGYGIFEPLVDRPGPLLLRPQHNEIRIHTWGDRDCCLPKGATTATLRDSPPRVPPVDVELPRGDYASGRPTGASKAYEQYEAEDPYEPEKPERALRLAPGDFLLFEEVLGPKTGAEPDADPSRRHVVRLTSVTPGMDDLYRQPVLEVEWDAADALPFPLCVSTLGPPPGCEWLEPVTIARGNIVLTDHGATGTEPLPDVPEPEPVAECEGECQPADVVMPPVRYRPDPLRRAPLTFAEPLPPDAATPAALLAVQDTSRTVPQVWLDAIGPGTNGSTPHRWVPRQHLLASERDDEHFVVEVDDDGRTHLRFGDDEAGEAPEPGTAFTATYRVGNGPAGNVGAETIAFAVLRTTSVSGIELTPRNPLPATGGLPPERTEEAKLVAPGSFRRRLERAVTAEDYAALAMREVPAVQRAAATLRWSGSWYEATIAVDALGLPEAEPALLAEVEHRLQPYRRMGHDLDARAAEHVPLLIELLVCVEPEYLQAYVRAALLDVLGPRVRQRGGLGYFHPDNLTFGQGVFLSPLVAAVQAVDGVDRVEVVRLERLGEGAQGEIENGVLPLGPFEIARLDNDPGNPEMGELHLVLRGGR